MKKFVVALVAISALAATPAMARSDTHISFGLFSPAPVYYQPAPVAYYPPVRHVYYAPAPRYSYGYGHRHRQGHGWGHGRDVSWNDRYDRGRGRY